jgi:hypothetical protein
MGHHITYIGLNVHNQECIVARAPPHLKRTPSIIAAVALGVLHRAARRLPPQRRGCRGRARAQGHHDNHYHSDLGRSGLGHYRLGCLDYSGQQLA